MRRGYVEISQESFKKFLTNVLPEDAKIYGFNIEPKTASIQIFFYSESAPDLPESVSAPFYLAKVK